MLFWMTEILMILLCKLYSRTNIFMFITKNKNNLYVRPIIVDLIWNDLHVSRILELTLILFHLYIWVVGIDGEGSYTWDRSWTETES